jgi:hypothetical protein
MNPEPKHPIYIGTILLERNRLEKRGHVSTNDKPSVVYRRVVVIEGAAWHDRQEWM